MSFKFADNTPRELLAAIETRFQFVHAGEFDRDSPGWAIRRRFQTDAGKRPRLRAQG
jgi:hypothetical protein